MELKGKFVAFLGDSITEGAGVADIANNRYDNVLKNIAGLSRTYNDGIGGSRIAYQRVPSDCARYDLCYCGRAHNLPADADVIVVFGGTNDYGHGDAMFGEMTDSTPATYCGAVNYLMDTIKTEHPAAQVVFMTPARRVADDKPCDDPRKAIADGRPLNEYCEVIRIAAAKRGIAVLDLYNDLGINPNNPEDFEKYAPDGLHLNDAAQRILAEKLHAFLLSL